MLKWMKLLVEMGYGKAGKYKKMLSIRLGKEVLKKGRALRSGQKGGVISSRDIWIYALDLV